MFIHHIYFFSAEWKLACLINFLVCFIYGCLIYFNLLPSNNSITFTLGEWVAISTNLIFVSFVYYFNSGDLFKSSCNYNSQRIGFADELMIEKSALTNCFKTTITKNSEPEQFSYSSLPWICKNYLEMISGFLKQTEK
jgi:subtilase family serine protease